VRAKDARSEYISFQAMKMRCLNKNHGKYPIYGGRGIKIHQPWIEPWIGFSRFMHDLGRKPSTEYTLERMDSDGDYTPSNCRWASREEQSWNKRTTRFVEYQGRTWCLGELAKELGLSHSTLYSRVFSSRWPEERWNEPVHPQTSC